MGNAQSLNINITLLPALMLCHSSLFIVFHVIHFAMISRSTAAMRKDPNKPRGKMTSYAYFVATCREEHKKKHPGTTVSFAEFSKKCSERWKVS